jgi:hypothetical protein
MKRFKTIPSRSLLLFMTVLANSIVVKYGFTVSAGWYWILPISLALLVLVVTGYRKTRPATKSRPGASAGEQVRE